MEEKIADLSAKDAGDEELIQNDTGLNPETMQHESQVVKIFSNKMDKDERAKQLIDLGRESNVVMKAPNGTFGITFVRADEEDWKEIKELSDKDLIEQYNGLRASIEHGFSIYDLQMQDLMLIELTDRGYTQKDEQ